MEEQPQAAAGEPVPGVLVIYSALAPRHDPVPLGPKGTLRLGSEALAYLGLVDEALAPRHAEVRWAAGGFSVRDLGSPAGTFLDEEALDVPAHGLREGVLRLGETLALLVADLRPHLERGLQREGPVAGPALQAALEDAEAAGRRAPHLLVWAPCPEDVGPVARRFASGQRLVRHPDRLGPGPGARPRSLHDALLEARGGVLALELGRGGQLPEQERLLEELRAGRLRAAGGPPGPGQQPRLVLALAERPGDLAVAGRLRPDLLAELGGARLALPSTRTGRAEEVPWLLPAWRPDPRLPAVPVARGLLDLREDEERWSARTWLGSAGELLRLAAASSPHAEAQPRRGHHLDQPRGFEALQAGEAQAESRACHEAMRLRRAAARALSIAELQEHLGRHRDDRAAAARALDLDPVELARLLHARGVPPPPLPPPEGPADPRQERRLTWAAPRFELQADLRHPFLEGPPVTAQLAALEALLARLRPALEVALDGLEQAGWTCRAPRGWTWLGTALDLGQLLRGQGLSRVAALRLETVVEPFLGAAEARRLLEAAVAALG